MSTRPELQLNVSRMPALIASSRSASAQAATTATPRYRTAIEASRRAVLLCGQVALLLLLNKLGAALVRLLGVPLPGTVAGLMLLFGALRIGVVRLSWIEDAATLLTRHLAFFFIPIAVGLMAFGDVLLSNGPALLAALVISAAVGIGVTGGVTQLLSRKDEVSR